MKTPRSGAGQDRIVLIVSLAITLTGVVVIAGWHAHVAAAVQVFAGLVPMQYNTALCLIALGAAGIGLSTGRRMPVLAGGTFAALMGGAVVVEYATGRSLGIDTWFFYPWVRSLSADPGRVAITTAFCFLLGGASLVNLALRRGDYALLGIVNSFTLSLALTSLVGYSFQITYVLPFSLGSQMAVHTSLAFVAHGMAMVAHAWRHSRRGSDGLPGWSAGIGVALLPVLFVGASLFFPRQTWPVMVLEGLWSVVGVALITVAVLKLTTVRVAYKGLLLIAVPLILLLAFVGLVSRVKDQSEAAQMLALHSTEVLRTSQSLLTQITEAESAVRGFVMTSDETFVAVYQRSAEAIARTTRDLRRLVADNPGQLAHATAIEQTIARRTGRFTEIFGLVRAGHTGTAQQDIVGRTGPVLMEQLRAELKLFSDEEERLGVERRELLALSWRRLNWLLVEGAAAAILLAVMLMLSFNGGISGRLERLRDNANSLAAGGELAAPLDGDDEIAELDRVFHTMAGSLEAATAREKANRVLEEQILDVRHNEALRKVGALQRAIFDSANFSSIATDANGVIQIFNVGAERMLGYAAADVVERITPAGIADPDEVAARAAILTAELGTAIEPGFGALVYRASLGIEDIYELTCIRKDGSRFEAAMSVTALRDGAGAIIGYLFIGTDNTARRLVEDERQRLDQRLRDQQFYTRSLIESNIDALMTTDPAGIVTDVNNQAEALTGRTRDQLIGAPFKDCFTDPGRARAAIDRVLKEGAVTNYELTARASDGSQTVVSCNATTFYDRDRVLQGVFAAARDMTELKLYERTLQQRNVELEHASRLKSEFLANMSHELRTPLNAIIGFSEVLRDGLVGGLTSRQRGFLGDVCASGHHLLSLINDILDLSKVEAGKMQLDLEPVQLSTVLANGLSMVKEKAAARRIRLDLDLSGAETVGVIQADGRKVRQIVYNLLSNAVKFSVAGGEVTVRTRCTARAEVGRRSGRRNGRSFPLQDSAFGEFVEIRIADNGIGISADEQDRLFSPFSQIDSGLARKFEGTGLGLVMVKLLTELHGGTVAVESDTGKGSCFTVWLPLRRPDCEALPAAGFAALAAIDRPAGAPIGLMAATPEVR